MAYEYKKPEVYKKQRMAKLRGAIGQLRQAASSASRRLAGAGACAWLAWRRPCSGAEPAAATLLTRRRNRRCLARRCPVPARRRRAEAAHGGGAL